MSEQINNYLPTKSITSVLDSGQLSQSTSNLPSKFRLQPYTTLQMLLIQPC